MRVARVSVVDGVGATVMDEFVRMDEGVTVVYVAHFRQLLASTYTMLTEIITHGSLV